MFSFGLSALPNVTKSIHWINTVNQSIIQNSTCSDSYLVVLDLAFVADVVVVGKAKGAGSFY